MSGSGNRRFGFALMSLLAVATTRVAADARGATLMTWVDRELAPYVATELTGHPRFKGETVVFVALDEGAPAPVTNSLILELRDRLVDALVDVPGVTIGWQPGREAAGRNGAFADCTRDAVHYYLGLEVTRLINGRHRVTLRALDAADRSWVTGTGKTWQGRLTRAENLAYERPVTDEYFRGSREVPYSTAQADMLAARLAHELGCALSRQMSDEYVIAADATARDAAGAGPVPGTLELVRNNLAGNPALQITTKASAATARLEGKAHPIASNLYQYWVVVTPTGAAAGMPAVSASAYVQLPRTPQPVAPPSAPSVVPAPMPVSTMSAGLIEPLRVVEPRQRRACSRPGPSDRPARLVSADHTIAPGECVLLRTQARHDASVFLLNYQVAHGLVNLLGPRCGQASPSFSVRAGQAMQFPASDDVRPSASLWQGRQGLESFYAVAVSDPNAARELSAHVQRLPTRCTISAVQGLTGPGLEAWLTELGNLTSRWQHALDWQAVRVQHVN